MIDELGLIGLGAIGEIYARNLAESVATLYVYDVDEKRRTQVGRVTGAVVVESPSALAAKCQFVVLALPSPAAVESVLTGKHGILKQPPPGVMLIDLSTIDPETARRMAALAEAAGAQYVDAPIMEARLGGRERTAPVREISHSWLAAGSRRSNGRYLS